MDSWITGLAAGLLDFRAAVFSDGWIAGFLGLWGDGLVLCIKAHCFNASDGINGFNSCERRAIECVTGCPTDWLTVWLTDSLSD